MRIKLFVLADCPNQKVEVAVFPERRTSWREVAGSNTTAICYKQINKQLKCLQIMCF